MSESIRLNDVDRERFADAVESSYLVGSRPQFFIWTHSAVQALLPHEILICGVDDGSRQGMAMHRFCSTRYFRQEHFEIVTSPIDGLTPRLLAMAQGQNSLSLFSHDDNDKAVQLDLQRMVSDNELVNLAAQLVVGPSGKVEAYYAFSRVKVALDQRLAYVLELLVPHVHNAFMRVLATERELAGSQSHRAGRLVTPRQEEILNLVKTGKTNAEIAELLQCSPWTIKNHIQAILRKLDSHTRTHAIARAMSMGILRQD
jgi:transcriptional regulator EpsA